MIKTYGITINGRVQGVGFRNFVFRLANKMSASGSVKNLADGSVEIVISISESKIDSFIDYIRIGNGFSEVVCIKISEKDYTRFDSFKVDYSAH